jgi:hypothetical protein
MIGLASIGLYLAKALHQFSGTVDFFANSHAPGDDQFRVTRRRLPRYFRTSICIVGNLCEGLIDLLCAYKRLRLIFGGRVWGNVACHDILRNL